MIKYLTVNDFEFIIGLDGFYRKNMMKYESKIIFPLLNDMIKELNIELENFHIEGYYCKTKILSKYFTIVQNLKKIDIEKINLFEKYSGYNKLIEIFCSGLFGEYKYSDKIIPSIKDSINIALKNISKAQYNFKIILDYAFELLQDKQSLTLVELGILLKNPIIVTALCESTVLYREVEMLGTIIPKYEYIWNVSKKIEEEGNRIIETFNKICPYKIPICNENNVKKYFNEFIDNEINYRCVRLAIDENGKNYHWAIKWNRINKNYEFKEFWDEKLWTTEDYKKNSNSAYFA